MLDRYSCDSFIIFDFSRKVEAARVRKILRGGVTINGEEHQFIGCSSSGLKERTCYMFKGTPADVDRVLNECGSFSSIKSRYKRLKRIALLFSSATPTRIEIPDDKVIEVADIETVGCNFTDGCGAVNRALAEQLRESCRLSGDYRPSVFQIRYQGCKGVVMINPKLKETEQLVIRPSMRKFNPGTRPFRELWLCDHSRPYTFGHLNRQFITLLSSLGVEDEVFLRIQTDHFERLQNIQYSPVAAFEMLMLDNQPDLASLCTTLQSLSKFSHQLSKLKTKFVCKLDKLHLPVVKSRNVFGVCDPTSKLQYGHCYFRYTEHGNCKTLLGRVVVAKNPCYLLGDVRVLTAVDIKELNYLTDCIVFPTQGERPHPSEIAGSDLDGDQYFVCWDEGLIVPRVKAPYSYPSEDVHETSDKIITEILIDYFASQKNNMGKIDNYYKYWANREGAGSPKCQELGQLFSRSIDATKTGDEVRIPPYLKPPLIEGDSIADSHSPTNHSTEAHVHVWEKMEKRAKEMKRTLSEDIVRAAAADTMSEEFIWSLLENKAPNLSEFHLLQLVRNWCSHHCSSDNECYQKLLKFAEKINFGEFTIDQQVVAIDYGISSKDITNALNKSTLLPKTLLKKFLLDDPHRSWRYYFHSSSANFNWKHLLRGLQGHPESMIVIELKDEVTFVLHFLSPPNIGETELNSGSVVAYFSSNHFNLSLQCVLGSNFKLILNEETLQLFRGKKTATFIWLRSEQSSTRSRRDGHNYKDDDALFDRISVDLTRFKRDVLNTNRHPTVNKQSFIAIEMFVKSKNFQPAYLDIAEADVQDDYPVEEASIAEDLEDLPSDSEEDCKKDGLQVVVPDPCPSVAALELLMNSAERGCCLNFQRILESLLSRDVSGEMPNLLAPLHRLLATMVSKYCHRLLPDEVVQCLQIIVASLYSYVRTPVDLLWLLSHAERLGLSSLMDQIVDNIQPNIHAIQPSEYIDIVSNWKLWYFLPVSMAGRLSKHFYSLYLSLCCDSVTKHTPERVENLTSSLPVTELIIHLASGAHVLQTESPKQHQIDGYVIHFSHLLLSQLLSEISASQSLGNQTRDTSSSLVRMSCCDYKPSPLAVSIDTSVEKSSSHTVIVFKRPTKVIASTNFTVGSYVAISLMKKQASAAVFITMAIGRIIAVSRHPANIVVEISEPVPLCLKRSARYERGHWQVVLVGNISSFERSLKALKTLREAPTCTTSLLQLIVHSYHVVSCTETEMKSNETLGSDSGTTTCTRTNSTAFEKSVIQPVASLNSSQMQAVCAALKQRLTLIHGPPGTGKTHVACEIVQQQLARNSDKYPILVAAETNLAVDNLCEKLMSLGLRVVRVGKLDHVAPPVRGISLEGQIEKKRVQAGEDKAKSQFLNKKAVKSILSAAQVVAATCTSAGDSLLKGSKFPFVIIDEAIQVTEPTSLVPLMYGCQQLVLIGDPEQLAPNCPAPQRSSDSELQTFELSVTLFHRLQRVLPPVFLTEQHRMHPELAKFPSCKFYGERLSTASSRSQQQSSFQEEIPLLERNRPLVFVRVSKTESRIGTSFCNSGEAKAVAKIINYLIDHQVSMQQMVILTLYAGQVKCIVEECQRQKLHHARVHTIDSFQGREADVVIFSTVRCNLRGELGFTSDRFRMNVLLTRAKHGLIGIGCDHTLSRGSPLWKEWLESVKVIEDIHTVPEPIDIERERRSVFLGDWPPGRGNQDGRGRGRWNTRTHGRQGSRHGEQHRGDSHGAEGRPTSTQRARGHLRRRSGSSEGVQGYSESQTQRSSYDSCEWRGQSGRGRSSSYHYGGVEESVLESTPQHKLASSRGRGGNHGGRRGRGGRPRGCGHHQRSSGGT